MRQLIYGRIKKLLKAPFYAIAGKQKWQSFFEKMYHLSLRGMHIGLDGSCETSGETYCLQYVLKKCQGTDTIVVFDVGANSGNYTRMIYDVLGEKAQIYAFEPSKETYRKMIDNTQEVKNLHPYNLGFGNENSVITLYSDAAGSGLASLYQRNLEHFCIEMNKEETVEIKTLDSFCLENAVPPPPP
ncbi:hypothetical protein AGMMS49579_20370 [Spirochaetia bacterium]|nr:hypothetical protein AGMMS49579_20370 [Spirochaetia bacterium]